MVVWGDRTYGQTNVPAGLSNVVEIAGGGSGGAGFCLARQSSGKLVTWGNNDTYGVAAPADMGNAIGLGAGWEHSLAIVSNPFRIALIAPGPLGPVLRFPSSVGRNYQLEYRSSLASGDWTPLPNGTAVGTGQRIEVTDTNAPAQPQRFYRVKTLP